MSHPVKYLFPVLLIALLQGCEDDPNSLGKNIIPVRDSVVIDEYRDIQMHVLTYDSAESSNTDYAMLGAYYDTDFGFTYCSFMTQWLPASFTDITGSINTIDSVVLTLAVNTANGPLTAYQELLVYPVTSSFTNVNYSNTDMSGYYQENQLTADNPVTYKINNSQLRVKLLNSYFSTNLLATGTGSNYLDQNTFFNFFRGLYFGLISNNNISDGGIVTFDLKNSNTRIAVHYNGSQVFNYIVTDSCKRLNLFTHDYSKTGFSKYINDTVTALKSGYIQTMAGVQCMVKFTKPQQWRNHPAILKAELIIPIYTPSVYGVPGQITATTLSNEGKPDLLPDDPFNTTTEYFDGKLNNNEYRINITRFVNECNLGKRKYAHLYLFPGYYKEYNSKNYLIYQASAAGQAIIKPADAQGIRIEITYLKITN